MSRRGPTRSGRGLWWGFIFGLLVTGFPLGADEHGKTGGPVALPDALPAPPGGPAETVKERRTNAASVPQIELAAPVQAGVKEPVRTQAEALQEATRSENWLAESLEALRTRDLTNDLRANAEHSRDRTRSASERPNEGRFRERSGLAEPSRPPGSVPSLGARLEVRPRYAPTATPWPNPYLAGLAPQTPALKPALPLVAPKTVPAPSPAPAPTVPLNPADDSPILTPNRRF